MNYIFVIILISIPSAVASDQKCLETNDNPSGVCFTHDTFFSSWLRGIDLSNEPTEENTNQGTFCLWMQMSITGDISPRPRQPSIFVPSAILGLKFDIVNKIVEMSHFEKAVTFPDFPFENGIWTHLCFRWDNSEKVQLFVNGKFIQEQDTFKKGDLFFLPGDNSGQVGRHTCLDLIQFFRYPLSDEEIAEDYKETFKASEKNILPNDEIFWCFYDGDSGTATGEYILAKPPTNTQPKYYRAPGSSKKRFCDRNLGMLDILRAGVCTVLKVVGIVKNFD